MPSPTWPSSSGCSLTGAAEARHTIAGVEADRISGEAPPSSAATGDARTTRGGKRRPVAVGLVALAIVVVALAGAWGSGLLPGGTGRSAPHFVNDTAASGLDHTYGGGDVAAIGGGVAVLDCDRDGRPDLFIAGGDQPAALFRNASPPGGALRFARVPDPVTDLVHAMGAYPIDIDGDGNGDLVVLEAGGVDILRGLGGCRFERANERWALRAPTGWEMAFSATWEPGSQLPTLAFGEYVGLAANGDATYACAPQQLFRPGGDGSGYGAPIALAPGYCALSMLFSDWDGSGRRDLRIANDRHYYNAKSSDVGGEQLWRIAPGEAPRAYTPADGFKQLQVWGMGIASQDLNGDGLPEVYITSQADNKLQTLDAGPSQPTYRDIALKAGVLGTRPVNGGDPLQSTAWHPEFADLNNDGVIDLYVSKGNIDRVPDSASRDPSNLYLGNGDGTFTERAAEAGIVTYDRSRGAAIVDLNGDGLLDLVEVKVNAPTMVWRNAGSGTADAPKPMGHWLGVTLREAGGNRDAIGAQIEVRTAATDIRRELVVGGGHISGELGPVHFGLGDAASADVRVRWPDGIWGPWQPASADQVVVVDRESGSLAPAGTAP
jgi:enediyne biosynthesis protein E4